MKRVAIESGLTPIREYLSREGFQVEDLNNSTANQNQGQYSAILISGKDRNMMGMEDIVHNCPVINCDGLTPEQVCDRLNRLPQ
ncbi:MULTISPECIES: YkuS family protein [Thermoactinomyces]|jgi:hypothetical protein|uniref:YkuS family protein n=1 Tax=Thermoactinomyces daqus TaxID=1329516 RepID=A0A7W1X9Y4_9BACL|nr:MULTISPECIES: YkuS family protein [Thermoactinomyces]MBA4542830.1 YkuS family protein [Thermoactinomyces daqus]MBH8598497.1 YkuS family protein [Thermoactinomyces sp. CICC 10523]MBH8604658.1 YkuS family protein [Thermoactinomyces sp. CICC 10522]MBH8606881.1 YkuS family protein [Thermoactinomyces sp. CICC 10521]